MKTARKFSFKLIGLLVCIGAAVSLGGCGKDEKPVEESRWVSREVVVSALDAMTFSPIKGATVMLENISVPENPIEKLVLHGKIDSEGKASLFSTFSVIEEGNNEASFKLTGDITINAYGYQTLSGPISSLTGEQTRSTDDKAPIHVVVYMNKE